jgi:hypothetical protein
LLTDWLIVGLRLRRHHGVLTTGQADDEEKGEERCKIRNEASHI